MTSSDGVNWTNATVTGAALDWSGRTINALTAANTTKGEVVVAGGNNGLILIAVPNGSGIFSDWMKLNLNNPNADGVVFANPLLCAGAFGWR